MTLQLSARTEQQLRHLAVSLHMEPEQVVESMVGRMMSRDETGAQSLVGAYRSLGPVGPVYEVIAAGNDLAEGNRRMRARLVETGEEFDYTLDEMLNDPLAR